MNGSRVLVDDERAFAARDPRLAFEEVVWTSAGKPGASIPILTTERIEGFSPEYRRDLGIADLSGPVAFVGGGLARFRAVTWNPGGDADVVAALVKRAVAEAVTRHYRPESVYVPEDAVDIWANGASFDIRSTPLGPWWRLSLRDVASVADFIERQPKAVRKAWRRDARAAEAANLSFDVVPYDDASIAAAAPQVAAVAANNGYPEPPALAEWRLRGYLSRAGEPFFIRSWQAGKVVAHTACRSLDDHLDPFEVGISNDVSDRRTVYHFAVFTAPLRVALELGRRDIEYGPGHPWPKKARGCIGTKTIVAVFDT